MNNDIWILHDWLIDQKKDNKVNENDCNYIIDHIRNNFAPNLENIFVFNKFTESVEKALEERDWLEKNFWTLFNDTDNGLPWSNCYKATSKLLRCIEEIEELEYQLGHLYNIEYDSNDINSMFGNLGHSTNTSILFTHTDDYDEFLIVLYDHENQYMFIFDNNLNCYGLIDDHKLAVQIIKNFENKDFEFKIDRLNNVKNYFNYLKYLIKLNIS